MFVDSFGRAITYLRISVTDRCNLRCVYCMPPEGEDWQPHPTIMRYEEIAEVVRVAAEHGVREVRLTGGEPLVRKDITELVRLIASTPGVEDVSLTTNALLLENLAGPLAQAGLEQVNISIDSLDSEKFRRITRRGDLGDVWRGIAAAEAAGLRPVKLNCVVTRGFNDDEVVDLARLSLDNDWEVRFIELMPLGSVSDFQQDQVVPSGETKARIEAVFGPLEVVPGHNGHDPARPYRIPGAQGQLGFISSVSEPFCEGCNRLRLTADGKLRLCLLRDDEVDLLTPLRVGADFETLKRLMADGAYHKPWGHRLEQHDIARSREMSQIGG